MARRSEDTAVMLVGPTNDHYSDRITTSSPRYEAAVPWEFDGPGLARAIVEHRQRLEWSTRDLARRSGVSQAYIVALERPRASLLRTGPTPTLEVVARLAHALQLDPSELFEAGLRRAGRHALLVIEDHRRSPLEHAISVHPSGVDAWIWATSTPGKALPHDSGHRSINLRRDERQAYQPTKIAAALRHELAQFDAELDGRNVGLVFAETSDVMSTLDDPRTVIAFEHRWASVVTEAAASIGAHAAWNVCVYEIQALRALNDPIDATLDLMRSHDKVWAARRDEVVTGTSGARRILEQLRPSTITPSAWRATTERLVDDLDLVA